MQTYNFFRKRGARKGGRRADFPWLDRAPDAANPGADF